MKELFYFFLFLIDNKRQSDKHRTMTIKINSRDMRGDTRTVRCSSQAMNDYWEAGKRLDPMRQMETIRKASIELSTGS